MSTQAVLPLDYAEAESPRRIPAWLSSSFWAVCDQGLFAMSNMVLNILLFRWLVDTAPRAYGGFTVAFAIFLLFGTLHNAFLIEPMLVFGNVNYIKCLPAYFGTLLFGELGFGVLTGLLLGVSSLVALKLHAPDLAMGLGSMALASPFILFLWLMRRACYVKLEPKRAALAGGGYLVFMLAGLFALEHSNRLNVFTACVVMAGSSLGAGLWLALREGVVMPKWSPRSDDPATDSLIHRAAKDHWHYGRWAAAAGLRRVHPVADQLSRAADVSQSRRQRLFAGADESRHAVPSGECGAVLAAAAAPRSKSWHRRVLEERSTRRAAAGWGAGGVLDCAGNLSHADHAHTLRRPI